MIASLEGTVAAIGKEHAIVVVQGVGYEVRMPSKELMSMHVGQQTHVFTTLNISQDAIALYGFTSQTSKELFIRLQKVSGIGPKVALSIVGTLGAQQLQAAVEQGDITALAKAPGLGKKGAQKIVLELKGSLQFVQNDQQHSTTDAQQVDAIEDSGVAQAVEGLMYLGWQQRDASEAVRSVIKEQQLQQPITSEQVPQVLKAALAWLDKGR
ncbi:Holliday junction ATP-dependent DNA helicase RuvA [Galliscardovia ingluviei]|uniref:Holliday junction branch migration complex subunit RuvA n=1 Tax=Galliscardovia ingluviei TaxID=1769422 RepID=A0A8J3AL28_9BIFI|nr:Holliday junction branch migration protein RuvA [Galliscardovia ingluviei]GGI12902.1 Holliday junction ATP-dependent DNA helicase RuvA [Galliscardovia ingluviei]